MRQFVVFAKKELTESVRTYKLIVMAAVFVLLSIMSPMLAKLMPEIIGAIDIGGGITFEMPEPMTFDAWGQFFKNIGQMGMLCVIIIYSGIMANEFSRGTLTNLLTKGLGRGTVIMSKFAAASLQWTGVYLVGLGVMAAYTAYFWELNIQNGWLALGGMWLFGELLIALLIFGGTLFTTFYGALALAGGFIIALSVVGVWPDTAKFNPVTLSGGTLELLNGSKGTADFLPALIIAAAAVVALLAASVAVFRRKKL